MEWGADSGIGSQKWSEGYLFLEILLTSHLIEQFVGL